MNLRWRDPVPRGRHASDDDESHLDPHSGGRGFLIALAVLLAIAGAVVRWATTTWLLGAHSGRVVHIGLVTAFFVVLTLVIYTVSWQSYRQLAKWSQTRRARQRVNRD